MRFENYLNEQTFNKIGVVGYSDKKFDENKAMLLLKKGFKEFNVTENDEIVSGLTDIGIPKIAYKLAKSMKCKTVGIACSKANEFKQYPVDIKIIKGNEWGDESKTFLKYITHLIKVGGGEQSKDEYKKFTGPKINYQLPITETTTTGDIETNTTKGNIDVISKGLDVLKSATGDDNLRVDLIKLTVSKFQVIVYMLKNNKWIIHETYDFDEKEKALNKYNKIIEEF